jgi:hypothetical protein
MTANKNAAKMKGFRTGLPPRTGLGTPRKEELAFKC